ncbi:hypothetical protein MGMO_50c00140 [Methyloglobulus morosus KoM1]|uniref:Uncharacterized protein n=1 Tax=Methyloglobulus morosus KoM1 TaxID=1116472 RepID=V5C7J1_9GAMM|nr:hypothetical protein [Methyloglobulus morosus]ESS72698.1 hypothetical protein MGMO_50c00140 [Methyloglobulus morosus KoM1]
MAEADGKKISQNFIDTIYKKISDLFGGDQLFCMEWPARPLNQRQYTYNTEENTSMLTRPMVIEESEFRLSDELFNVAPITGGPNGQKLSIVYNTLINNFVPDLRHLGPYIRDRAALMGFLLAESTEVDEKGKPKTRIQVCKELYNTYLTAKNLWLEDKDKKYKEIDDPKKLDDFAKWVSREGLVRDEMLNNLFNDAVVRGMLHEVLTTLGYLNVSTTAEELERTKQRMRASQRQSVDASMLIYPVNFQPSNWYKALKPNLSPKDLLMSREVLMGTFKTKQDQLRKLQGDLAQVDIANISPEELAQREKQLDAGKKQLQEAENKLIEEHGNGALMAFKVALDAYTGGIMSKINTMTEKDFDAKQLDLLGLPKEVAAQMLSTYKANSQHLDAAEQLARLRTRVEEAKVRDFRAEKLRIQDRINQLNADLQFLQPLLGGVENMVMTAQSKMTDAQKTEKDSKEKAVKDAQADLDTANKELVKANSDLKKAPDDTNLKTVQTQKDGNAKAKQTALNNAQKALDDYVATLPNLFEGDGKTVKDSGPGAPSLFSPNIDDVEGENMFMDVVITSEQAEDTARKIEESASQNSSVKVSGWFFSAGSQSSTASASFENESNTFKGKVELGFRVAKVTFDRGGWFNPQIFKMSQAFFRLADIRAGAGATKDLLTKALNSANPAQEMEKLLKYPNDNSDMVPYQLPAFPVAMVIAKDITIKIEVDETKKEFQKDSLEKASTSGGGFLGFSVSNASASSNLAETSFYGATSNHLYMRIPGPQILGWFLELVEKDRSKPYEALFDLKGEGEAAKILQSYDKAVHAMSKPETLPKPNIVEPALSVKPPEASDTPKV